MGSESLSSSNGDGSVSRDEVSHNTSSSLDSNGKRSTVKSNNGGEVVLFFSRKDSGLNGSSISDTLIRVAVLVQSLSIEAISKDALDSGNSARSTDEDDLINVFNSKSSFLNTSLDRVGNFLE